MTISSMARLEDARHTLNQSEDDWLILEDEHTSTGELQAPLETPSEYTSIQYQQELQSSFSLLNGEKVISEEDSVSLELSSVDNTWLSMEKKYPDVAAATGRLYITNYQIVFVPQSNEGRLKCNNIPLCVIGSIGYLTSHDDTIGNYIFQLKCKDWRLVTFTFGDPVSCTKVYQQISSLAFANLAVPLCRWTGSAPNHQPKEHIISQEYNRLGLSPLVWRISSINERHEAIPTYPANLIVPAGVSDEVLNKASAFRSNGRIPTVCWVSPSGAAIARSSQPLVGLWSARSEEDETLVRAIFSNNPNFESNHMYIVDCRPKLSAVGNMAKGLGYERVDCYSENCEIVWMGVDNIHAMRDSFRHMYKLCLGGNQSDNRWLSNLEYTKWLDHLHLVINSSIKVAEMVQNGSSVLIHCSDGWDRTPQLICLAMLFLDPYYRTVQGFITLIETEWISFGHKFQLRSGHGTQDFWTNDQCSPIFLQWVDCVWQITQQFPQRFEFNDKFLVDLIDNVYNCRFSEFLYNNEKESSLATQGSPTLRSYYEDNLTEFMNPFYEPQEVDIVSPDSSPKMLRFWTGYYLRYYQSTEETMTCIQEQGRVLKNTCSRLETELQQVKAMLEMEAKKRESLEHKLYSAEHEAEELRKRTVECKMMMEEDLEDLGYPSALKKLHFDIIEDYTNSDNSNSLLSVSPPSLKQQLFSRKRSCP